MECPFDEINNDSELAVFLYWYLQNILTKPRADQIRKYIKREDIDTWTDLTTARISGALRKGEIFGRSTETKRASRYYVKEEYL